MAELTGGYGVLAANNTAVRESEVTRQMNSQMQVIGELESSFGGILKKLEAVTAGSKGQDAKPELATPMPVLVPLADAIRSQTNRIRAISVALLQLIERIEL